MVNSAAQRKQQQMGGGPPDAADADVEQDRSGREGEAGGEKYRWRRRGRPGTAALCSCEDAFWWTAAFLALVFVANYAYYTMRESHSFTDWLGYAGTEGNDPGGCHCRGHHFGEHCKARLGRTKIYLPVEPDALRACEAEEFRAQMDLSHYFTGENKLEGKGWMNVSRMHEAHAIADVMEYLSDPLECTHGYTQHSFKAFSIPPQLSLIHSVAAALPSLSASARAGKSFQFLPQRIERSMGATDFCKASSRLACFLKPTSTCGAITSPPARSIDTKDPSLEVTVPPRHLHRPEDVPIRFRTLGNFWYFAQLLKFLWRPNEPATQLVRLVEEALGIVGKRMVCAVVDDCVGEPNVDEQKVKLGGCVGIQDSLDRVMPAVGEMGLRYNLSTVFLVTDSLRTIAATSKYNKMEFKHLMFDSSSAISRLQFGAPPPPAAQWMGGTVFREAPRTKEFTPKWAMEMVGAHPDLREFVELEVLSRCSAFVAPFSSEKVKLGYQLAVARQGWYPPYISTDHPLSLLVPPRVVSRSSPRG